VRFLASEKPLYLGFAEEFDALLFLALGAVVPLYVADC